MVFWLQCCYQMISDHLILDLFQEISFVSGGFGIFLHLRCSEVLHGSSVGIFASIVLSMEGALPIQKLLSYNPEKPYQVTHLPFSLSSFSMTPICVCWKFWKGCPIFSLQILILYILVLVSGRFLEVTFYFILSIFNSYISFWLFSY